MSNDKKTDLDRLGLFQQPGYHTINDPYPKNSTVQFNVSAGKGVQMKVENMKTISALNEGYFAQYERVFEGESYSDAIKIRRELNRKNKERLAGKIFRPPNPLKKLEGSGNYYGTFAGPIVALSNELVKFSKSTASEKRNLYTSPAKKGTGYGYLGLTFNKYPEYKSEPYVHFKQNDDKENKYTSFKLGKPSSEYFNCNPFSGSWDTGYSLNEKEKKNESFAPFIVKTNRISESLNALPKHESDPYNDKSKRFLPYIKNVVNNTGKTFYAIPGLKTTRTTSILSQNINRSINNLNYGKVSSVFTL